MNEMKMLALAVVAAAALAGFMGTGTASATFLCKNNTTPCKNWVAVNTIISLHGTHHVFKPGFATIECEETDIEWKLEGQSEVQPPTGNLTALSLAKCDATVKVLQKGSLTVFHTAGTMNGTVSSQGLLIELATGGVNCKYGTPTARAIGPITAGSPAIVKIEGQLVRVEGGALCTNPAPWNGTYSVSSPNPLYISDN